MTIDMWLRQCGLPRLEGRMLLQHVLKMTHAQLITRGSQAIAPDDLHMLDGLSQQRHDGQPMAYLLGVREFYGRDFRVNEHVLIPRPETELLVEAVLFRLPEKTAPIVWDLGTGSGAIACTLALENTKLRVHASDISADALQVAQDNAITWAASVSFHQGSWYEVSPSIVEKVDVLVSNPPYIEADDVHLSQGDLRFEPQGALTDFADGLSAIRQIIDGAPEYLLSGGYLLIEHGFNQGIATRAYFADQACWCEIATLQDYADLDRITLARLI